MRNPCRRTVLAAVAAFVGSGVLPHRLRAADVLDALVINSMPSTPSVVVARMLAQGGLDAHVRAPVMKIWRSPDQMRSGILAGDVKVVGAPSYSAANMANRGVPLRQLNILTWGLVYVMSRDPAVQRLEDLAGRRLLVAFRNDAPDLIFRFVAKKLGMNPDKDIALQYVGTPTEAVQLLLAGKADAALIPEPACTAAELRGAQTNVAVHRAIDLTEAYGKITNRPPRIAQSGLAVREELVQSHPELVAAIHKGCVEAAQWVAANPTEAGRLGAGILDMQPAVIERSLPHFRLDVASAAEARADMERYFTDLMEMSPDILGGRLPDARFYWGAQG
jgi:NitT/TauT family transport system substrate-binding protein